MLSVSPLAELHDFSLCHNRSGLKVASWFSDDAGRDQSGKMRPGQVAGYMVPFPHLFHPTLPAAAFGFPPTL